jgi:hypothetical protein
MMNRNVITSIYLAATASVCLHTEAQAGAFTGTGFFITTDGYLVTVHHVVREAKSIKVRDSSGELHEGRVILADVNNDLVILKVQGVFNALPVASSRTVRPGAKVVTMGFPHIDIQGREPKVTEGIVNSVSGLGNDPRVFQISVPVQAGNSGGPLVNMDGAVIGIVTSKLNSTMVLKETGDLPENVNYAIKSNYLVELASNQDEIERNLQRPRKQPFARTEQVADELSKAVALVIAEVAEAPPEFPNSWVSSNTGKQYSIKVFDDRLQFVLTGPGKDRCRYSSKGDAAKIGGSYSGTAFESVTCPPEYKECQFPFEIHFDSVTPTRIEGNRTGVKDFNGGTCAILSKDTESFVWVPQ